MKTVTTANIITLVRGIIEDNLKSDGRDSERYDQDTSFLLSKVFVSEATIKVFQNGTELTITTDWTYNSSTNRVTITSALVKNDDIIITFSYYDQYSDAEILAFINTCLSTFVVKRYEKYFYIDDNDEVVTLDGVNPTVQEANIMAIITAIDIDPNNITIKTKDYTISPEENLSTSKQIDRVFSNFLRSFGSTGFLET